MAENRSRQSPTFASLDELVEELDKLVVGEHEDLPEDRFGASLQRRTHLVAIDEEINDRLTEIAEREQTPAESLVSS